MSVLIAASECVPLVKTGGLADVIGALPGALRREGVDARVLLPGYPAVLRALRRPRDLGPAPGVDAEISGSHRLLAARTGKVALYVLDAPRLYDRPGNIYEDRGRDWPDNPSRFGAFSQAAAGLARHGAGGWRADVLNVNDWQTGLAPVYLDHWPGRRVPSVMTIHNISYQGLFDRGHAGPLGLPDAAYGEGWEYYGRLGFLKAGLMAADRITTVSPGYAREILTSAFGHGLDGVLRARRDALSGILNGADTGVWNPARDRAIPATFSARDLSGKAACRQARAERFGLDGPDEGPIVGVVSRLTAQKGIDLLVEALPALLDRGGRFVLLGSGEPGLERAMREVADVRPGRVGVEIGYDEALSHLIYAGADAIAGPSRFEPCGLTQLYALAYGALPVVARTGGLGDTVIDANPAALMTGAATGIVHDPGSAEALGVAFERLVALWAEPDLRRAVRERGMRHPVGWGPSAAAYARLYRSLVP
ncbi:MAG: glycogen synthase GlgA [Paracoccaceae bacterium]